MVLYSIEIAEIDWTGVWLHLRCLFDILSFGHNSWRPTVEIGLAMVGSSQRAVQQQINHSTPEDQLQSVAFFITTLNLHFLAASGSDPFFTQLGFFKPDVSGFKTQSTRLINYLGNSSLRNNRRVVMQAALQKCEVLFRSYSIATNWFAVHKILIISVQLSLVRIEPSAYNTILT